jgi:hypothetical protein
VWIIRIDGQLTPSGIPVGEIISSPNELGDGTYELHWFGSAGEAKAFRAGIVSVGLNSIDVTLGVENGQQAVLVHRRDRDTIKTESLEEAVPLFEHANARNRRLNVIWSKEIEALRGASVSPDSTFTAAQISSNADENVLPFVFKYDRWKKHPNFENIKDAGAKNFEIVRRDGQRLLLWKMRELATINSMGRTRGKKYRQKIEDIAREFDGKLEGNDLAFSINGDLPGLLTRIIPAYSQVYHVDHDAMVDERKRKIYELPQVQQVINLLVDGGTIEGSKKPSVVLANRKPVRITQKIFYDMQTAEIIEPVEGARNTYKISPGVVPLNIDPYDMGEVPTMTPK